MLSSSSFPLNRFVIQGIKFFFVFLRVTGLMFTEIVIFPLLCGIVIDYPSAQLFSFALESRVDFFKSYPLIALFAFWYSFLFFLDLFAPFSVFNWLKPLNKLPSRFLGTAFMFHMSSFVGVLREFLRPGVLWFLRNPQDPSFQPMREMIELPLTKHIRRIFISALFYCLIVGILFWIPIYGTKFLFPSLFPLKWSLRFSLFDSDFCIFTRFHFSSFLLSLTYRFSFFPLALLFWFLNLVILYPNFHWICW